MILESLASESSRRFSETERALKIRNWMATLEDIPDELGVKGLKKALKDGGKFMPSVGKFRQMCLTESGCHDVKDEAQLAWGLVINNLNGWRSPVFKDSAIAETIRQMGGWSKLCSMSEEEIPFRKIDFLAIYPILKRQKKKFYPVLNEGTAKRLFIGGKSYPNFKFIGFAPEDNLKAIAANLEAQKRIEYKTQRKILGMLAK